MKTLRLAILTATSRHRKERRIVAAGHPANERTKNMTCSIEGCGKPSRTRELGLSLSRGWHGHGRTEHNHQGAARAPPKCPPEIAKAIVQAMAKVKRLENDADEQVSAL